MSSIILNLFFIFSFLTLLSCTEKPRDSISHHEKTELSYAGNVERSIDLKLNLNKSTISTIRARISVPYDYSSKIVYKWKLGQDVKLAEGSQLIGEISSLKKSTPVDVYLRVENFNSQNQKFVRFEAFGTDPKRKIFVDGIVSSNQETSFESIVQEVEKINEKN